MVLIFRCATVAGLRFAIGCAAIASIVAACGGSSGAGEASGDAAPPLSPNGAPAPPSAPNPAPNEAPRIAFDPGPTFENVGLRYDGKTTALSRIWHDTAPQPARLTIDGEITEPSSDPYLTVRVEMTNSCNPAAGVAVSELTLVDAQDAGVARALFSLQAFRDFDAGYATGSCVFAIAATNDNPQNVGRDGGAAIFRLTVPMIAPPGVTAP